MDSPGSRPGGGARVAPPADGLVLYRRARRSVQSSESNELQASQLAQDQQDVRKRNEPEGANTVPQVRESGAATEHAEARTEHAPGGTTPKARLPILLG